MDAVVAQHKLAEAIFGPTGIDWFGPLTLAAVRRVNKLHRKNDDSTSWPICGQFNVTERAIRRLRRQGHDCDSPYSYDVTLSQVESELVNNSNNW